MSKVPIFLLCLAVINAFSCKDNHENGDDIALFILSAEVVNKQTRNIVVDNDARRIDFDLARSESKTGVNIKLTLADGVSMLSPKEEQADYNLTYPAEVKLSANGREVVFTIRAGVFDPITEFILAAEVTNREARNLAVNNTAKEITFDFESTEAKTGVNIRLTLADGVSMVSPATTQADYDLTNPASIELFADERTVVFTIKAGEYVSTSTLLEANGWVSQTTFGELNDGILLYKAPPVINGRNVLAYLALGDVHAGVDFHVLGGPTGGRTPAQFYNDNNQEYPVITNGGFFDSPDGTPTSFGQIVRNGEMLIANRREISRHLGTYFPTTGVFSRIGDNMYRTDWVYTVSLNPFVTYAYPAPAPNRASPPGVDAPGDGLPPLPRPSATYPVGGWIFTAQTSIGAGPILIKDGEIVNNWQAELIDFASPALPQPRTAIGFTKDGQLLLFVCQGRNTATNTLGFSYSEMAELLLNIGCVDLLNLDGGGSTCMLVNGKEVFTPSDGSQRSVVTAIGIK